MGAAYAVLVGLFLLGLLVRDGYEMLKQAERVDTTDGRVFAVVFTSMCVMWVSWFGIGLLSPARLPVPDVLRWIGLAAVVLGSLLAVGGMWQLGGVENIDHLVSAGLFARIRHPMYAGFALWIVGWCAYQGALASLLLRALALASVGWWRFLEERDLESRYGRAYAEYRARTWF